MKTLNKFLFIVAVVIGLTMPSCKDNILTPVADSKSADSLVAMINNLNTKLVTVNAKDNSLQIQLAKFQSKNDSLKALASGNYSQLVQYTVYIVDGGNSVTGVNYYDGERICKDCKTTGVDGATVTVNSNGQTYTQVSADGRAIFNNLYVAGLATVTITANGYTRASYTTYFNPSYASSGSISSVSPYSSSLSTYPSSANNISPSNTSGSGSGALFNVAFGYDNVTSITITNPGSGYKNGDLITFYGGDICDCSGSVTYKVAIASSTSSGIGNSGTVINASTNVLILPTAGKNVTTYNGQLYINKSVMDDTLGRLYQKAADTARYLKFISPNGPYHGSNYTYDSYTSSYTSLGSIYTQNQYFAPPEGNQISFTNLTTLGGVSFIYGYPTYVSNYYDPNYYSNSGNAYQYLPGDIISITYTGLTSFATIDATGKYTMVVPSFQNNPGTTIGATSGVGTGGGGNLVHVQDNYTHLSTDPNSIGSTHPTLKLYNNSTYGVTPVTNFYQVTDKVDFYPYIELDNGGYAYIGGYSGYTQYFYSNPGQTVSRNVFFFATHITGQ